MKPRKMFPIIAMLLIVLVTGCKKDDEPGIRPTVTSTDPLTSATNRGISEKISATFSVAMDPSAITNSSFTLKQGTINVDGVVSYAGTTASFTPTVALAPNALHTATITTAARNMSGTSLSKDYTWSFTTGAVPDSSLPSVTVTDPANNATNVAIDKVIVTTFSEAMDQATINGATFTVKQGSTAVAGTVTKTATTGTFTPTSNFEFNKVYTGTITIEAKDAAGNALATNYTFSFTTGVAPDTALPTVNVTDPLSSSIAVAQNKVVSLTFSEAMNASTINSSTLTLKQGTTPVEGIVAYSGTTATFTPANILSAVTIYTATITTGAKDLAGNALAANTVWSFTTGGDIVLPTVNSTDPLNNATNVARNKVVSLIFSEAMDVTTINATTFTLMEGTTPVAGTVAYVGTTATFTPTSILTVAALYTATVTTGAKDIAGNALAANIVWSFTTASMPSTLAAVDLGAAGNYVILAKTAITNISTSAVTGDLGLSPAATSYVTGLSLTDATGYATSAEVTGKIYAADMADPTPINLTTAVNNMITAYTDAAGRPSPDYTELATGNIGGRTLTPGLYKWSNTVTLPSSVIISGGANDVWIFQIAGDLTMSNAVNITLIGGAQAKNIFWQVAGTVTVGTTAHFEGIILSQTGITFQTGASFKGRALAQTAVILDMNAITQP